VVSTLTLPVNEPLRGLLTYAGESSVLDNVGTSAHCAKHECPREFSPRESLLP
jgi:hypothetical protein